MQWEVAEVRRGRKFETQEYAGKRWKEPVGDVRHHQVEAEAVPRSSSCPKGKVTTNKQTLFANQSQASLLRKNGKQD
jgi:hypothetical protein